MTVPNNSIMMRALADVLRRREGKILDQVKANPTVNVQRLEVPGTQIDVSAPQVHNHVPVPEVHNEVNVPAPVVHNEIAAPSMDPVVAALDRFTAAVENQAEMLSQLVQVLAAKDYSVQVPSVVVPAVDVQTLADAIVAGMTAQRKREATIKHSDGTTSTVLLKG